MRTRRHPAATVPAGLIAQIEAALEELDAARARMDAVASRPTSLDRRRRARAELDHAFGSALAPLREAVRIARESSYVDWCAWRGRLSRVATLQQLHEFARLDDDGVQPLCSVRAVDTGMSGPAIGELQHGRSMPPGSPARYGQDLEALLHASPDFGVVEPDRPVDSPASTTGTVVDLPPASSETPPAA